MAQWNGISVNLQKQSILLHCLCPLAQLCHFCNRISFLIKERVDAGWKILCLLFFFWRSFHIGQAISRFAYTMPINFRAGYLAQWGEYSRRGITWGLEVIFKVRVIALASRRPRSPEVRWGSTRFVNRWSMCGVQEKKKLCCCLTRPWLDCPAVFPSVCVLPCFAH